MTPLYLIKLVGLFIFAYILGSIPCGLVFTRMFCAVDPRQKGSRNIGAANVRRVAGSKIGALTLIGDMLKGALPVYLAYTVIDAEGPWDQVYISIIAYTAFMGHLYPLYLKFKNGGKGVATAAGSFLVISPMACIIAVLVFILFICVFNHVSAGSLAAAAALPAAVWLSTHLTIITACSVLTGAFIYFRHLDNIKRIFSGAEPVIWEKKKNNP